MKIVLILILIILIIAGWYWVINKNKPESIFKEIKLPKPLYSP